MLLSAGDDTRQAPGSAHTVPRGLRPLLTVMVHTASTPALAATLALICVSAAPLIDTNGFSTAGLILLLIGVGFCAAAAIAKPTDRRWPGAMLSVPASLSLFYLRYGLPALGGAMLLTLPGFILPKRRLPYLLVCAPLGVLWLASIHWVWGQGTTDVFGYTSRAVEQLLHGHNPYSEQVIAYQEIRPGELDPVAAPFSYLPTAVLASIPGVLLGDVRLSILGAWLLASLAMITLLGKGRDRLHQMFVCMAIPIVPIMVTNAFVDMYAVAGLLGWLALRDKKQKLAVLSLGFALAVKPVLPFCLILYFVRFKHMRQEILAALFVAGLIVAPFAVGIGIPQFLSATIVNWARIPPYSFALSINSEFMAQFGQSIPTWVDLTLTGAATLLVWLKGGRGYSAVAFGGAFITLVFVSLSPYAFINFYIYPVVLLLVGLIAGDDPDLSVGNSFIEGLGPSRGGKRLAAL